MTLHYNLANLLLLHGNKSEKSLYILIDSLRYNTFFSDMPPLGEDTYFINVYRKMPADVFLYIITTRKICTFVPETLTRIFLLLNTTEYISNFFSFYDHNEIINIIWHKWGWNDTIIIYEKLYTNSLLFRCVHNNKNIPMFKFIMDYLIINKLLICNVEISPGPDVVCYYIKKEYILLISEYDNLTIFRHSLRYAWMNACIII